LGAKEVVGVDIDRTAIQSAHDSSRKTGCRGSVQWITGDVGVITGKFDTVLQNPPFGIQKRSADRKFLEKALGVADVVYSLHNHPTVDKQLHRLLRKSGENLLQIEASPFMKRFVEEHGGTVKSVFSLLMTIPKMFDFHTKAKHEIIVDLYVIEKKVFSFPEDLPL
jgi:putative methylase